MPSSADASSQARGRFGKDVLRLASGASLAQVLNFLITPILTRIFPPEAFGVAGEFVSIITIAGVVASLRYELAIMLPAEEEEAGNVLATTLMVVFASSTLVALFLFFFGAPLLKAWGLEVLLPYQWAIPITMALAGIIQAFTYWHSRHQRFGTLAWMRLLRSIGRNGVALGAGLLKITSATGLIIGSISGYAAAAAFLVIKTLKHDLALLKRAIAAPQMIASLKRYRKFPLYSSWGGILNALSWQVPVLLLGIYFSAEVVGYYSLSRTLLQIPSQLIGGAVAEVFYQRGAVAKQEGSLARVLEGLFVRLVRLGFFPIIVMAFAIHDTATFLLGNQWGEVGVFAQILSISIATGFIAAPLGRVFSILERQEVVFTINALFVVGRISSIWIGHLLNSAVIALGLFSVVSAVLYLGYSFWAFRATGISPRVWYQHLGKAAALSAVVVGAILLLRAFAHWGLWQWLFFYSVVGLFYGLWLWRVDAELRRQLLAWWPF